MLLCFPDHRVTSDDHGLSSAAFDLLSKTADQNAHYKYQETTQYYLEKGSK